MKRQFFSLSLGTLSVLSVLAGAAQAKSVGADPPFCPTCTLQRSATTSALSRTEGNLVEQIPIATTRSTSGPTVNVTAVYDSYNADGSRAVLDTVLGYGWTHTFNIFLFNQLGALFRYGPDGRVTKFGVGTGGTWVTATGYFETLTKTGSTTYTITEKDKTVYTFNSIPGSTISVGGPVYQLTGVVDRNGNTTTLSYSGGNLTGVADTYGRTTTFTYNSTHHITTVADPDGRVTTFTYDSTGHKLSQVTDPTGKTVTYTYDTQYQLSGKTDRDGRTFTYTYSAAEPVSIKDSTGNSEATLSNSGNWATNATYLSAYEQRVYTPATTSNTDGRGNVWKYQYDSNGYILQTTNPNGTTLKYTYDPSTLQPSSMTDANGNTTLYQYDSQGNMLKMTDTLGHVTTYTYEPTFNMMTSMTDPRGRITTYTYDTHGNRTRETDPLGQTRNWTYDSHGNMLTATDKNGNTMTYQYDSSGDVIKQIDPLGNTTTSTYDAVGNVTAVTDANGHTTSYQYDALNRMVKETDPLSNSSTTAYDNEGNRIQTTDRNGHITTYQYDSRQRMTQMTDALSHPETYTYDGNDNRITLTDRDGHTTTYTYDTQNRLITLTDALGNATVTAYDSAGNQTARTDANGHTTSFTYDVLNRRSTMTDAAGNVTQYQYDTGTLPSCSSSTPPCGVTPGSGSITEQIDPNGKVTYYKYDVLDRTIDTVRKVGSSADTITPSDAVTIYTYDAVGNRLTVTEPDGNTTTLQYDADNRMTQQTDAAGDVTTSTYDAVGNRLAVTEPNGNVTTNTYDALNRVVQVTDTIGLVATYTYDPEGNRLSQGDGNGNITTYTYDALNRIITDTDPASNNTTTTYDAVGNPLTNTDRNENTTTYTYDAINRRITTTDALDDVTQSQYDAVGNLIKLTDADTNPTQYSYDAINRLSQETYPDGTNRRLTYDGVGDVMTRIDENGVTTNYSYNDLYFLLGRSYPSTINDSFTYDLSGRVLSAQHGAWPITFSYDGADRITQTVQNGHTIRYSYNVPGRTRTVTYPGGRVITENTDARSRMDHIDDPSSPPSIVQYSYDLGDRVTNRSFPRNQTSATWSYNTNDWITSLQHTFTPAPTLIAGYNYAYDNEGNKQYEQKLHDLTHSEAYQYDAIYRLINYSVGTLTGSTIAVPSTQTGYNLDAVGNWVSKTTNAVTQNRTHNSVNELTRIDSTNLTYDADGNLLNDGTYTYTYDEENRLLQVTLDSDSSTVATYQYDALGRRVQKIVDRPTAGTTQYFYDRFRSIEEQDGSGNTLATYVFGNYVDEVLTMTRAGQTYYYHQNALQSVGAITDSTGAAVERYSYDAYGAVTVTDGSFNPITPNAWGPHSAIGNPYTFTGRLLDEETALYYYRARMYDAAKGRFLQRDPMDYTDSMNLYEYGRDNPLTFADPLGTEANQYGNMTQEELTKLWEKLVYSRPGLEILAGLNPDSDFARKYGYTPQRIQEGKEKLKQTNQQIEELKREFARRQAEQKAAAKPCPAAAPAGDPCGIFWVIMNMAGEFDVVNDSVKTIETIATIGSLGAYGVAKPAVAAGSKMTKEAIKKWLADKLKELPGKIAVKGARKLMENVLDPQAACFALAECESNYKGNNAGYWQRTNALGRVIRSCTWNNGTAYYYKSGWRDILPSWLGGY